ncbi:hypothetical protein KSF_086260 [Reticulibacter mediterranei]|uniref:Uncharacterized protein n=1 Tax=Reticulibacter mediterranei TaxID=2778369 RepID=A0A8J3IU14_9CHLR|nr:hypothetical protein [Reticulibacter mediterranei]GHO98578.1 hypothetical protein KSF_086260 [Reticulibacter mediterranei]
MPQKNMPSELLELAVSGTWIAEHRRIWQMKFLNPEELAQFCSDRGLSNFGEEDIIHLWQLGLLKADLIESETELHDKGLVDHGINQYKCHIYSDERQLQKCSDEWNALVQKLAPLQNGTELLFHPFRYYVLHCLNRANGLIKFDIAKMQMFNQSGLPRRLDWCISFFKQWFGSEQFMAKMKKWNDTASLSIVTEPYTYMRIFNSVRYDPSDTMSYQTGVEEIRQHMADYGEHMVKRLYQTFGMKRLEEIRQDLCIETQLLDPNRWIHTLLCLGESELRLTLEGHLGGALLLRTMAEMLRRATENTFNKVLREEDELGLGWIPENVKEKLYGSNRVLDDRQAGGAFARRHGLNYKPRVHLYGEGETEFGALSSFFKTLDVPVTNLHGLIKQGNSMGAFFRDELQADIRNQVYSLVIIDKDVPENVRVMESAARNNQANPDDGIFGRFFLSDLDFEFANFEVDELETIVWKMVQDGEPSQADRDLLHNYVKETKKSAPFFKAVEKASLTIPQLIEFKKGKKWGEALMKYAWEHPFKQGIKRQIIEAVELALFWEKTSSLELYEESRRNYMIHKDTGELVERTT